MSFFRTDISNDTAGGKKKKKVNVIMERRENSAAISTFRRGVAILPSIKIDALSSYLAQFYTVLVSVRLYLANESLTRSQVLQPAEIYVSLWFKNHASLFLAENETPISMEENSKPS